MQPKTKLKIEEIIIKMITLSGKRRKSYSVVAIKAIGSILPAIRLQLVSQKRELVIIIVTPFSVKAKSDRIET